MGAGAAELLQYSNDDCSTATEASRCTPCAFPAFVALPADVSLIRLPTLPVSVLGRRCLPDRFGFVLYDTRSLNIRQALNLAPRLPWNAREARTCRPKLLVRRFDG